MKKAAPKTAAAKKAPAKKAAPKTAAAKKAPAKKAAPKPLPKKAAKAAKPSAAKPAKESRKPATLQPAREQAARPEPQPKRAPAAKGAARKPPEQPAAVRPRARSRAAEAAGPLATWIAQADTPRRPSSFIPAPPRAESAYTVAAPPASSDRLFRPGDIDTPAVAIRTLPVRVDVEQSGGRTLILINPLEQFVHHGDGIEWDFRYLGGADVIIEELQIEFPDGSVFGSKSFRTRNPGSARPHRHLSGPVRPSAPGGRIEYVIRAVNVVKMKVAEERPVLVIED